MQRLGDIAPESQSAFASPASDGSSSGRGGKDVLHLLERAEPGEPSFPDRAARRDDLLVQPLAVAADHDEPGMGNHGEVLQGTSRERRGP